MNQAVRQAGSRRRVEIERDLARLPSRPPRVDFPRRVSMDAEEYRAARCWRRILANLGPFFAACGSYFASRPDVFAPELRSELASLANALPEVPLAVIHAELQKELGQAPESLFPTWSPEHWQTQSLFLTCRTRLLSGEPVSLKLARPNLEVDFAEDSALLSLLAPRLQSWVEGQNAQQTVAEVLAMAQYTLAAEINLELEAEAVASLADSWLEDLRVPRVYGEWSTRRLLVLEDFATIPITERPPGSDLDELAVRFCSGWLRQVLLGSSFPRLPALEKVEVSAEGRVVFRHTGYVRQRPSYQDQLLQYLQAAADHDPERTTAALEAMASASGDEKSLRYRIRQLQPLRETNGPSRRDELGEHLLLHWQLAAQLGFKPRPALIDFYRSLGALQGVLRHLAPEDDALLAAFEQLRLDSGIERWRQRMAPEQLVQDFQSCVTMLMRLPKNLDRALAAAENGLHLKLETRESPREQPHSDKLPSAVALFSVFSATILLHEQLAALPTLEMLGAVVLVLVAGLLLKHLIGS